MSYYLLELKLSNLSFEAEELHITLPKKTRIFTLPLYSASLDIPSPTSSLKFEFRSKSQIIFKDNLNPSLPISKFSDAEHRTVEFITELHILNKSKIKKSQDSLMELQETIKSLKVQKTLENFQDFNFLSVFQTNFNDQSSEEYIKYLECVVEGLAQKVKSYEFSLAILKNNEKFGAGVEGSDADRNSNEFLEFTTKGTEIKGYHKKNDKFVKENLELNEKIRVGTVEMKKLQLENEELKGEVIKMKMGMQSFEIIKENMREIRKVNSDQEKSLKELREIFKSYKNEQQELVRLYENNLQEISEENSKLLKEVNNAREKIKDLEINLEKVLFENFQLEQEVSREKTSLKNIEKISQNENKEKESLLIQNLLQQIEQLKKTNSDITQKYKEETKVLLNKCSEYENIAMSNRKAELRRENHNSRSSLSELSENSSNITKSLFGIFLQESKSSFGILKEIDFKSVYENSSIYEHSEKLSKKLLEYSRIIFEYEHIISKLVEVMREFKSENFALRERLFFAQHSLPLYIPVKGDPLDFAMAEYVNNLKRPLKIPFVRQDPGFYLFGSRNIKIRLINNKPHVYAPEPVLPIEDFVSKFTKTEITKFEEYRKSENQFAALEASRFVSNESAFSMCPVSPAPSSVNISVHRSGSNASTDLSRKNPVSSTRVSHSKAASLAALSKMFLKD